MKIMTVRGEISPENLGFTTFHEHTNCVLEPMPLPFPMPEEKLKMKIENMNALRNGMMVFSEEASGVDDADYLTSEFLAFKEIGGGAVVDASPIGIRGNVSGIREASERADLHVVCATGLYHYGKQPEMFAGKTESELMAYFEKEICDGIDDTGIRPGFLKCAMDQLGPDGEIHEVEQKTIRACARVAEKYGMSVHIHSGGSITARHVLNAVDIVLNECGVQPGKLVMLHMDSMLRPSNMLTEYMTVPGAVRTVDTALQESILEKGVNISFDTWGTPFTGVLPDDYDRMKALIILLNKGYASQIVFGHDTMGKPLGVSYGYHGFTRFATFVPPLLRQFGFPEDIMHKIAVENPARILMY
ncbi:MAG: hypothetical protein Q4C60_00180 [Eubacteriales bacterium]|nr:hypothetical protein [Eubacteriales bacterium]